MTDEEYLKQIKLEWEKVDDDPDWFDELINFEELDLDG